MANGIFIQYYVHIQHVINKKDENMGQGIPSMYTMFYYALINISFFYMIEESDFVYFILDFI